MSQIIKSRGMDFNVYQIDHVILVWPKFVNDWTDYSRFEPSEADLSVFLGKKVICVDIQDFIHIYIEEF